VQEIGRAFHVDVVGVTVISGLPLKTTNCLPRRLGM
jgi:hypothetical protein